MKTADLMLRECLRKRRYHTAEYARTIAQRVREQRGVELRVYHCSLCDGFHLTKKAEWAGPSPLVSRDHR